MAKLQSMQQLGFISFTVFLLFLFKIILVVFVVDNFFVYVKRYILCIPLFINCYCYFSECPHLEIKHAIFIYYNSI